MFQYFDAREFALAAHDWHLRTWNLETEQLKQLLLFYSYPIHESAFTSIYTIHAFVVRRFRNSYLSCTAVHPPPPSTVSSPHARPPRRPRAGCAGCRAAPCPGPVERSICCVLPSLVAGGVVPRCSRIFSSDDAGESIHPRSAIHDSSRRRCCRVWRPPSHMTASKPQADWERKKSGSLTGAATLH